MKVLNEFVHLRFKGVTTSPWSIGRRSHSDVIYCQNYLWGRAVRGPVLNYLLKVFCPNLPTKKLPCDRCSLSKECPFYNLYGADKEGSYKDTPKLIVTSLTFKDANSIFQRIPLISRSVLSNSVALGPVFIEFIPPGVEFEFEVIFTGEATRFVEQFKEGVRATLALTGWGGQCSRGYGRGKILGVEERDFEDWVSDFIDSPTEHLIGSREVELSIHPIMILLKDNGEPYTSILEDDFRRKLRNSMQERYWQFFKENYHMKSIKTISGPCYFTKVRVWSRKESKELTFGGLAGEMKIEFREPLNQKDARVIGVCRYGVGRYKNQGFGSLRLKMEGETM